MGGNIFIKSLVIGITLFIHSLSTFPLIKPIEINDENIFNISNRNLYNTVYVNNDYNETTRDWNITHFNNIQKGINATAIDGIVYVHNGTYNEHLYICKSLKLLGLDEDVGEDKEGRIINGNNLGNIINIYSDNVKIGGENRESGNTGFKIINSGKLNGAGIFVSKHKNVEIINNLIFKCHNGIALDEHTNAYILYNKIQYCYESGIYYIGSEWTKADIEIRDNLIINNEYGIQIRFGDFFYIRENEFFGNVKKAIYIEKSWNVQICSNNFYETNDAHAITINCWNKWIGNYWDDTKKLNSNLILYIIVGVKTIRFERLDFTLKLPIWIQIDSSPQSNPINITHFPWQDWTP